MICFRWEFVVPFLSFANASNYIRASSCNIVSRWLIYPSGEVFPVPSILVLEFLKSARKSSGWPSSNIGMLVLYISDVAEVGFLCILILMMLLTQYSYISTLMSGISGGSIHACTSALSQLELWAIFVVGCLGLE